MLVPSTCNTHDFGDRVSSMSNTIRTAYWWHIQKQPFTETCNQVYPRVVNIVIIINRFIPIKLLPRFIILNPSCKLQQHISANVRTNKRNICKQYSKETSVYSQALSKWKLIHTVVCFAKKRDIWNYCLLSWTIELFYIGVCSKTRETNNQQQ